jgi:peroxiredoxin
MKKLLGVLLMAAPFMGPAQNKPNFEIKGKLDSLDISMVYVVHSQGFKQIIDSAKVTNHTYNLKGYLEVGQQTVLMTYNMRTVKQIQPDGIVFMFLSPGTSTVTHTKKFHDITISGPAGYNDYKTLTATAKPYEDKNQALKIKAYELLKQKDTIAANNIYAEQYAFEQGFMDKIYGSFIKQHPKSPVAFFALQKLAGTGHSIDGQKLKPYFDMLPPNIKASEDGQQFNKRITDAITFNTKGAIGSLATDFTLLDIAGHAVKLSDFKGKYVLLDLWASWCSPCRADNPHLVAAYNTYHQKGFDILSVSLDTRQREKAWHNAINHDHLTAWAHVADLDHETNSVVTLYGVSGIPQNFLIAPDGKIIARSLRDGDLEKQLSKILNN